MMGIVLKEESLMQATMFVRVLPLTVFLLLPASPFAQTDSNMTPAQLVDALNALFGKQTATAPLLASPIPILRPARAAWR
jgi:hypothetical protein